MSTEDTRATSEPLLYNSPYIKRNIPPHEVDSTKTNLSSYTQYTRSQPYHHPTNNGIISELTNMDHSNDEAPQQESEIHDQSYYLLPPSGVSNPKKKRTQNSQAIQWSNLPLMLSKARKLNCRKQTSPSTAQHHLDKRTKIPQRNIETDISQNRMNSLVRVQLEDPTTWVCAAGRCAENRFTHPALLLVE